MVLKPAGAVGIVRRTASDSALSLRDAFSDTDDYNFDTVVCHDFRQLPYVNSSVHFISARSLHQGIRYMPLRTETTASRERSDVKHCLMEFNRILVPGGRLEYIYFERELTNSGPLTQEVQDILWDTRCHAMVCQRQETLRETVLVNIVLQVRARSSSAANYLFHYLGRSVPQLIERYRVSAG